MQKQIIHKKNYLSSELVNEIREYFNNINDSIYHSGGPYAHEKAKIGWQGCWDRNLHYERVDNPIHQVVSKLKEDFGNFIIHQSSLRYLCAPVLPHTDITANEWLVKYRDQGYKKGYIFLIPLWWKEGFTPCTPFFNSPANVDEPLYSDLLDVLPNYSNEYQEEARNFSVREIVTWKSPGDLIAWENFQWHSSGQFGHTEYVKDQWIKEFISIKTWLEVEK